jgi:asparagine synthase (glutamine-hydrolysing)
MCGFVAIYKLSAASLELSVLERMTHSMAHRGPDDFGFMLSTPAETLSWKTARQRDTLDGPGVAFGHRRLSILDLSESGHQPFMSCDHRFWMVYNGEVFNYIELRAELTAAGYRFTTNTDTEVILQAFACWGRECFNRFNGMWAIVIWDTATRTLTASRDRFGIKPLHVAQVNGDWIFASEAKAILLHPAIARAPNRDVLLPFLGQGTYRHFVAASDRDTLLQFDQGLFNTKSTFFSGIEHLEPATTTTIKDGVVLNYRFWNPPHNNTRTYRNVGEAAEVLRALFTDAVKLRLRSDVGVGTMLSGGVDSTSVICTVKRLLDSDQHVRNVIGERISAFHASFPGLANDEAKNVDMLSRHLDLGAQRVLPLKTPAPEIDAILRHTIDHLESPFFNSVPIVLTLLMRRARSIGVKVILNGHGADELFAGYPIRYFFFALADMISNFQFLAALSHFERIHRTLGFDRVQVARRAWKLLRTGDCFKGRSRLDTVLRMDLFTYLLPHWLQLEDRISMSESIEVRLPFLDYRIVEFALSLDDRLKISNGTTKFVLREAMKDRLPHAIATDSRKIRFSGPDMQWLTGPLRPQLEAVFIDGAPLLATWLRADRLRKTVAAFVGNPKPWRVPQIWRLLSAELFLRQHFG